MIPQRIQKTNRTLYEVAKGQITNENIPANAETVINIFNWPILSARKPNTIRPTAFIAHTMASKFELSSDVKPISAAYSYNRRTKKRVKVYRLLSAIITTQSWFDQNYLATYLVNKTWGPSSPWEQSQNQIAKYCNHSF